MVICLTLYETAKLLLKCLYYLHSHWQYSKLLVAHLPHQHCYSHCSILNLNHPNRYIVVSILVLLFLMTNNGRASLYVFICLCFLFSEVSV